MKTKQCSQVMQYDIRMEDVCQLLAAMETSLEQPQLGVCPPRPTEGMRPWLKDILPATDLVGERSNDTTRPFAYRLPLLSAQKSLKLGRRFFS